MKPTLFVIRKQIYFLKPFIVKLDISDDVIRYSYDYPVTINGKQEIIKLFNCYLNRFELQSRNDWKAHSRFGLHLLPQDVDSILYSSKIIDSSLDIVGSKEDLETILKLHADRPGIVNRHGYLLNSTAIISPSRPSSVYEHALLPGYRVLSFQMKFQDDPFTKMIINTSIDRLTRIESNCNEIQLNNTSELRTTYANDPKIQSICWQPDFKVTVPSVAIEENEIVNFKIQLINSFTKEPIKREVEVYLDHINGYLPKTRIQLDKNGQGVGTFIPLGLKSGDSMTLKVGFKYFTNKQEVKIEIV